MALQPERLFAASMAIVKSARLSTSDSEMKSVIQSSGLSSGATQPETGRPPGLDESWNMALAFRERAIPGCIEASLGRGSGSRRLWLRGSDSNRRPPGYEPDELPLLHPATE
jgi:hypothetical protein